MGLFGIGKPKEPGRIEIYEDLSGEWRWRAVADNNEIAAVSGDGFRDATDAERAAKRARSLLRKAPIQRGQARA